MKRRSVLLAVAATALLLLALPVAYTVAKMGKRFEFNRLCCLMPKRHNMLVSAKETLGLLTFPSQIGQDRWVAETIFPGVKNGYFLDVGSADGFINNNTWALERRGWTGICVDPFPSSMSTRTCRLFKEPVDSASGRRVTFAAAGEVGGITDLLGKGKAFAETSRTVELTTVTLDEILARAGAPTFIHFISLDIEGAELEALRGFSFAKYKFGAMVVEHNQEEPKRSDIERLLTTHGYQRVHTWMQDDFYLPSAGR